MDFAVLILICAAALAPAECDRSNAKDVIAIEAPNEIACGLLAQQTAAQTGLVTPGYKLVTRCIRTSIGKGNVG